MPGHHPCCNRCQPDPHIRMVFGVAITPLAWWVIATHPSPKAAVVFPVFNKKHVQPTVPLQSQICRYIEQQAGKISWPAVAWAVMCTQVIDDAASWFDERGNVTNFRRGNVDGSLGFPRPNRFRPLRAPAICIGNCVPHDATEAVILSALAHLGGHSVVGRGGRGGCCSARVTLPHWPVLVNALGFLLRAPFPSLWADTWGMPA